MTTVRNRYNALINNDLPAFVGALLTEVEQVGAWTTGIESDEEQRGSAINTSIYGYDEARSLAVVQVRECVFRPGRYNRVRKDYYLIGRTEKGNVFAHPVDSPARSKKALESPEATVRWALCRIWDVRDQDLDDIERQGDVAFVPVVRLPAGAELTDVREITLRDTHVLTADAIYRTPDGTIYVRRGARLRHTKRQHAPIRAKAGVYRVQPGVRATTWGFTAPQGD